MKAAASSTPGLILPYIAVLLGLYMIKQAWAAILLYHAGMIVMVLAGGRREAADALRRGWSAPPAVVAGSVMAAGGLMVVLLWELISLDGLQLGDKLAALGLSGWAWWIFMVYYFTIHSVIEELYWRHHLPAAGQPPALIDAAFSGYHVLVLVMFLKVPWILLTFGLLWLASWIWRRLTAKYSGLGVAIASHAVADLSIIAGVEYLIRISAS